VRAVSRTRRIRVIVDERERPSGVPDVLKGFNLMVDYRVLEVGDYIVSRYAVERKEVHDFVRSLYSGRIFDQAQRLAEAYERPILIVEGDLRPILEGKIKPQAYWGAVATLALGYGLHAFFTPDEFQTANLLYALAKRKIDAKPVRPLVRKKPRIDDLKRMQIFQVSGLPGVGPKTSERLLKRFKTVRGVFTASVAELSTVRGLGRVKAEKIARFLDAPYQPLRKEPQQLRLNDA